MNLLQNVTFELPVNDQVFLARLMSYFREFVKATDNGFSLITKNESHRPVIHFEETAVTIPTIQFDSVDGSVQTVTLSNDTVQLKVSHYDYSPISLASFQERMANHRVLSLDHVGFNLPWFEGIHPKIKSIRQILSKQCLYHTFPTGEPWDFILPGSEEEIAQTIPVNYSLARQPKLEIVSFATCSTPLIQFDFSTPASYEVINRLFPEGIALPEVGCVWVYIENPYGIDVCLVVNQPSDHDWSSFFAHSRLLEYVTD